MPLPRIDWQSLGRGLGRVVIKAATDAMKNTTQAVQSRRGAGTTGNGGTTGTQEPPGKSGTTGTQEPTGDRRIDPGHHTSAADAADYPGDFVGVPTMTYEPHPGDTADPGEVVWSWVPYEEDHSQGKDRPSLVVGMSGRWLLALPLTSKDHHLDGDQEARAGRYWDDVGRGEWDKSGRESDVRLDRIVQLDPGEVRRIGGKVPREVFERIADGVRRYAGM